MFLLFEFRQNSFESDSDEDEKELIRCLNRHSSQRLRRQRRKQREHQLFVELSVLPEMKPLKPYTVRLISCFTSIFTLISLNNYIEKFHRFTIDTENDFPSNQPSIIQVEWIDDKRENSIVLVFEMAYLPKYGTPRFEYIAKLFRSILKPSNKIYGWGNIQQELSTFVQFNLFTMEMVKSIDMFDVQYHFKYWYNEHYPHRESCIGKSMTQDHPDCCCQHRPYKYENQKWSLQLAIAKTFNEFLDKRLRLSPWNRGLSERSDPDFTKLNRNGYHIDAFERRQHQREKLIKYAIFDCFATTKLASMIE